MASAIGWDIAIKMPTSSRFPDALQAMTELASESALLLRQVREGNEPKMPQLRGIIKRICFIGFAFDVTIDEIVEANVAKLQKRHASGTIQGDGDVR